MDARVSCLVPTLVGEIVQASSNRMFLDGSFAASSSTPRLGNFTEVLTDPNGTVNTFYKTTVPLTCIAGGNQVS